MRKDTLKQGPKRAYLVSIPEEDEKHTIDDEMFSLFAANSKHANCPRITVTITCTSIEMGVDTQASINALTVDTYERMAIKPELMEDKSMVFSFDGVKPLKSRGKFKVQINANGKTVPAEFIVFKSVRDNLLSYKTSIDLGLINLTCVVDQESGTIPPVSEEQFYLATIEKFPLLFSGKIGKVKDFELKLHIDKTVQPSIAKTRRIPFLLDGSCYQSLKGNGGKRRHRGSQR